MERKDVMIILSIIASIITVSTFLAFVIYPLHHPAVTSTPSATSIVTPTPQITLSPSPSVTPTPLPSMPTPSLTLSNDIAFLEYILDKPTNICRAMNGIKDTLEAEEINYPELETQAANLEALAEKYLIDIEEYHVSEELSPVKIKIRESFFEVKFASQILKKSARNHDLREVENVIDRFKNSLDIMEAVYDEAIQFLETLLKRKRAI